MKKKKEGTPLIRDRHTHHRALEFFVAAVVRCCSMFLVARLLSAKSETRHLHYFNVSSTHSRLAQHHKVVARTCKLGYGLRLEFSIFETFWLCG